MWIPWVAKEATGLALSVGLEQWSVIVRSGRAIACTTVHQHEASISHAAVPGMCHREIGVCGGLDARTDGRT